MRYALVKTKEAQAKGFVPARHRLIDKGARMVLNENELRTLGDNLEASVKALGGDGILLTLNECQQNVLKSR